MRFDKAFYTRSELIHMGCSDYKIKQLMIHQSLKKINASYYENLNYKGIIHDYNYMPIFVYEGTLCLLSAASYYGYIKDQKYLDIALPQGSHFRSKYSHPPFRFHYYSIDKYTIGTTIIKDNVNTFKIYNKERTICDLILERKKLDHTIIKTIINAYLKDPDYDKEKLYQMAQLLNCYETLKIYLDMIL